MNKTILYVGNDLGKHTKYVTVMDTFSNLLEAEGFTVIKTSDKKNQLLRIVDMCLSFLRYQHKVAYVFIDTFSTKNFYYAWALSQLSRLFRKKYIPILHGGNLPHRLKKSKRLSRMIFKHSYKNVAPSHYLKEAFQQEGYESLYIPNVIDIDRFELKKRSVLKPTILWVRAFKHLYNPIMAIDVLQDVKQAYPEAILCMVGPQKDDSYDRVQEKIKAYSLEKDVEFTGVLSQEKWHQKSKEFDIFINTTNFDNTPLSIIEAMALGIPIVSTNAGGMPFLIEHQKDGILVEKEDSKAMSKAIMDLLKNGPQHLAENARHKAESFAWETVKKKWFEIL
jgi:glycosyltransferase involved in cell wall biosynthesis